MHHRSINKIILRLLGSKLIEPAVNVLCKTLRIEESNKSSINKLLEHNQNMVLVFWHGTMLIPWYLLKKHSPCTIISKSKDGDLLSNLLTNWGYDVKRGSSSKGGKKILEELITAAKENKSIAMTPDGPKGPKKVMKAGGVIIAKKVQIPLILVGVKYKRKMKLNSWDNLEIPLFFSASRIIYSDPIYIDNNLSYEETDNLLKELSNKLNEIQNEIE